MKLWLISQTVNTDYDTYDSVVVAAETEDDARLILPNGKNFGDRLEWYDTTTWASAPDKVTVKHIGEAKPGTERGVVLASFNAG